MPRADAELVRALRERGTSGPLEFLDVGASDGTTTLDTIEELEKALQVSVRGHVADRHIALKRYRLGPLVEYRTGCEQPVLTRMGRLGVVPGSAGSFLERAMLRNIARLRHRMRWDCDISLVNPIVTADRRIVALTMDIFHERSDLTNKMDIVRASNVLNCGYFEKSQILTAASVLSRYLRNGGLFLCSRNCDELLGVVERGTIWRKEDTVLTRIADFGGGSELNDFTRERPELFYP